MAMKIVVTNEPQDAYLGGLQAFIASVSPLLLKRDRWGYHTLEKCFGIDGVASRDVV